MRRLLGTSLLFLGILVPSCGQVGGSEPTDAGTEASAGGTTSGGASSGTTVGATSGSTGPTTGATTGITNGPDAAPPPPVRFIVVGDTGRGDQGQDEVASAMALKCQTDGCDFVLMVGDNIYDSGVDSTTDPQWQTKFETPYRNVSVPFYPVLGNHDYGAEGAGTEWMRAQHEVDYTAVSTKWKLPARYHHFTKGDVEFFALDTNAQLFGLDSQQRVDVKGWLTASTATWKIAYGHHPYTSNGPHGDAGGYDGISGTSPYRGTQVKDFADTITCGVADVYFCGHDHSRQWAAHAVQGDRAHRVRGRRANHDLGRAAPDLLPVPRARLPLRDDHRPYVEGRLRPHVGHGRLLAHAHQVTLSRRKG